jgi:hypothetical protein
MDIRPDYSQVKNEFEPLPEGSYPVRIDSFKVDKEPAVPVINWTLKVFGHPKYNGRSLFVNTPIGGEHAFILQRFVKAALPEYNGGPFKTEQVVGKKIEVSVIHTKGKKDGTIFANVRNPVPYVESGAAGSFDAGQGVSGDVPMEFSDAPKQASKPTVSEESYGFGP